MAAAEIQIVNPSNLQKIESFLNDSAYKEAIENSANFNTRLCVERRLRMPFLDLQTGVAQTHCSLFMTKRQRMPGMREGQIYTYPSQRWRKARRQYLTLQTSRWGWSLGAETSIPGPEGIGEDSCGLPGDSGHGEDSRDGSQSAVKDDPKEWFYDELAIEELEGLEEPEPESDEDYYDDTYANRRRRRGGSTAGVGPRGGRLRAGARSQAAGSGGDETPAKRGRSGRGRRRAAQGTLPYEVAGDAEKPYGCELCGARYKTRPGLTYHYTHSHKEPAAAGSDGEAPPAPAAAAAQPAEYQDSYVTFLNNPAPATASSASTSSSSPAAAPAANRRPRTTPVPPAPASPPAEPPSPARPPSADTSTSDSNVSAAPPAPAPVPEPAVASSGTVSEENGEKPKRDKASPSPYCDFCLGDNRENKKTGTPEELVSCSDCGRSGKEYGSVSAIGRFSRAGSKGKTKPKLYAKDANGTKDEPISNGERNGHCHFTRRNSGAADIIVHSKSYSADDFDSFVMRTQLLECGGDSRPYEDDSCQSRASTSVRKSQRNSVAPSPDRIRRKKKRSV